MYVTKSFTPCNVTLDSQETERLVKVLSVFHEDEKLRKPQLLAQEMEHMGLIEIVASETNGIISLQLNKGSKGSSVMSVATALRLNIATVGAMEMVITGLRDIASIGNQRLHRDPTGDLLKGQELAKQLIQKLYSINGEKVIAQGSCEV